MQIFRVKKLSCKILKTENCVPFEVQYTSTLSFHYIYEFGAKFGLLLYGDVSLMLLVQSVSDQRSQTDLKRLAPHLWGCGLLLEALP